MAWGYPSYCASSRNWEARREWKAKKDEGSMFYFTLPAATRATAMTPEPLNTARVPA